MARSAADVEAPAGGASAAGIGGPAGDASAAGIGAAAGQGSVVRTWAMRGTLHLVAADDLPLVLELFGALNNARSERRLAELGLPPEVAARSTEVAADVLAEEGPLTRYELAERLRARGIAVAERGQAAVAVVRRAALAGVLAEVGVRGREELYGRVDPGPRPDREAALAELGRRYAAAHAPATAADLAAWSGLPAADVRRAWAAVDRAAAPDARRAGESDDAAAGIRLLPARPSAPASTLRPRRSSSSSADTVRPWILGRPG